MSYFGRRIFKDKSRNQEGVIISDVSGSPGGLFAATTLDGARFYIFFPYFVYTVHFKKFTRGSSLLMEKNQKQKKVFGKKKKKKENRSKEKRKIIPFAKRVVLAELHAGPQISDIEVASNYNFESCLSIRCHAPQHISQFFHFCRGFCLCLFATLPITVPPSSTLQ